VFRRHLAFNPVLNLSMLFLFGHRNSFSGRSDVPRHYWMLGNGDAGAICGSLCFLLSTSISTFVIGRSMFKEKNISVSLDRLRSLLDS
jgi:hypothetical protein